MGKVGSSTPSIKAFWETIEARLAACSVEELRALLRTLAERVLPSERRAFLEALTAPPSSAAHPPHAAQEPLLEDIDELGRRFEELERHADLWEAEQDWGGEEDALGPYEPLVEPTRQLFERARRAFEQGRMPLAREAHRRLFALLDREDDEGRGVHAENLGQTEGAEARARYLRAVYLGTPPEQRAEQLLGEMRRAATWLGEPPRVEEWLEVWPEPLPEWGAFLRDWEAVLRGQEEAEARAWLREAVRLARGARGLHALARQESARHPRAWLELVELLEREGRTQEVVSSAREALKRLPGGMPLRARIADHLARAGAGLERRVLVRVARWEAFAVEPSLSRLLDLRDAYTGEHERVRQMRRAARHLEELLARQRASRGLVAWSEEREEPGRVEDLVLGHAHLLAHDWEAAWRFASREERFPREDLQTFTVAFFLVLLSGGRQGLSGPLARLWRWGLEAGTPLGDRYAERERQPAIQARLEAAHADFMPRLSVPRAAQDELLAWCERVVRKRAEDIAGRQRRGHYGEAALLLAACDEVPRRAEAEGRERRLVAEFRERFPRLRALHSELDKAPRGH